ncbi:MAG: ATP-binding cassette domain-containing protein [Propionibacterium sp.]|nr:ATP-binding cassette domain-containing protein [Propionibacterium sp.]
MAACLTDVEVLAVSHQYGKRQGLADASLTLPVGVTGLLGPNGAGKTTLMKLLATALPLQRGTIRHGELAWTRKNAVDVRRLVGYLPQRFELMEWSTLRRNVEYAAWAQGLSGPSLDGAVDDVLATVDLADRASDRARALSGGMRQRLGLACAMVHRPPVLVLDEPTVGLDPVQRQQLRRTIVQASEQSVVLISTHLVEDLATVADQVVVMREGEVRFTGSLDELRDLGATLADQHASPLEAGYHAVQAAGQDPR